MTPANLALRIDQGATFRALLRLMQPNPVYKPITDIAPTGPVRLTVEHGLPGDWPVWVEHVRQLPEANRAPLRQLPHMAQVVTATELDLPGINATGTRPEGGQLVYRPPVDLTDATAELRLYEKGSEVGTLPVTVNAGGWVDVELSAAETAALAWRSREYVLDVTLPNGDVLRAYTGTITVEVAGAAAGQVCHGFATAGGDRGQPGPRGAQVVGSTFDEEGRLIMTLDDGSTVDGGINGAFLGLQQEVGQKADQSALDSFADEVTGAFEQLGTASASDVGPGDEQLPTNIVVNQKIEALDLGTLSKASYSDGAIVGGTDFVRRLSSMMLKDAGYTRVASDGTVRVGAYVGVDRAVEYRLDQDGDGLTLIRGGFSGDAVREEPNNSLAHNFVGSFVMLSNNRNAYTSQVGATFDVAFTGKALYLRHYADNRGGVWRVTVDSESPVEVSTYSALTTNNKLDLVLDGLSDGPHGAVFEYLGADPENPPAGGTARGWFNYLAVPLSEYDHTVQALSSLDVEVPYLEDSGRAQLCAINSVLEFALSSKPAALPVASSWVPYHGNAGAARNIVLKVWRDGEALSGGIADIESSSRAFQRLVLQQTYDAYNTNDASNTLMWSGVITHTFTGSELVVTHKLTYAVDTVQDGYLAMLPTYMASVDLLRVNATTYPVTVVDAPRTTGLSDLSLSGCWLTGNGDSAFAITGDSFREALIPKEQQFSPNAMFFSERVDGIAKLYWRARESDVTPAGAVQTVVNRYILSSGIANIAGAC